MAERATWVEPNGVTVTVDGEVVVRGDGVRPDPDRPGKVLVSLRERGGWSSYPVDVGTVTRHAATGWLFGHEVAITAGRDSAYELSGYAREGAPPFATGRLEDDGSFWLAADDLSDVEAVESVADTVVDAADLARPDRCVAGAFVLGPSGPEPLRSLAPVPLPGDPTRPGVQHADGRVTPLVDETVRRWVHRIGVMGDRSIEVLAERDGLAFVGARNSRVVGAEAWVGTRLLHRMGSVYVAWLPVSTPDVTMTFERDWAGDDGLPLLHGRYGVVDGAWRSLDLAGLPLLGREGEPLRVPGHALACTTVPVPVDDADYQWSRRFGARSVTDDQVHDSVTVRTTARVAGIDVELYEPWDPMTDGAVLLVRGTGRPGPPVLLSDGYTFEPGVLQEGSWWMAQARRDHLDDVRTEVVE